ncbi:MAG: Stk1 family PASTA domain-containing Ser/Thr kinase [Acidimicrobiales bacterium]
MSTRVFNDRYEIARHLARGGMAEVYLATDRLLDRPVALKVLFPEFSTDRSFVERFRREARAAAGLNHPNIVSIYDWGQEGTTYFIVMEYVEGQTLRDVLRAEGRLSPQRVAEIGAEIAAALGFAHRNGVVHRDVKPGNVILSPSGQVKVADFGIARAGEPDESLTQTGAVMGTATYFSPEQAQGSRVDARSDVYSLGVVLYELLTGRPPFTGQNPLSIAYQHVREAPPPPSQITPDVPPALETVVATAMAKDPDARYASAEELRADLLRYLSGRAVLGQGSFYADAAEVTRAQPRADTTRAMAAAGGVGALAGGAGAMAGGRRRRLGGGAAVLATALIVLLVGLGLVLARQLAKGSGPAAPTTTVAATVSIPSVIGQPQDAATKTLTDAGLKVAVQTAASDRPSGEVLAQDPAPGASAHAGDTVTLRVSAGPAPVTVPDVRGRTLADARQVLSLAGLRDSERTQASDQPKDQVLDQSPAAGAALHRGDTVTLTVSAGPQQVSIPDVVGKDVATATNQLGTLGLVTNTSNEPSDTVDKGKVTRTDPPAGTQVAKGSTVTVFVSSGPASVRVPTVVGETQAQATDTLTRAGFNVSVQYALVTSSAEVGRVIDQSPRNTSAPRGSVVTITVGRAVVGGGGSTTSPGGSSSSSSTSF